MENIDFPDKTAIIVTTKTLDIPSKTRIATTEGAKAAQKIYRELLTVTSESLCNLPYHVAFTGSDSPGALADIFAHAISFFPQTGDSLGDRMRNACLHCNHLGYSFFIVIGCDCPERDAAELIHTAYCLKQGADVVLGPVEDGGYHLAGVNSRGLVIFNAKNWSMPDLLAETCDIVKNNGLNLTMLEVRSDIDTIDDYRNWKARQG